MVTCLNQDFQDKIGRMEEWKIGKMEGWENERMEDWKNGRWMDEEWVEGSILDVMGGYEKIVYIFLDEAPGVRKVYRSKQE